MPWTDEMVESLKKMWDEGISTGEIGKRLGVSKNSIVGKVHRLQLTARPSPIKRKTDTDQNTSNTKNQSSKKENSAKSVSSKKDNSKVAKNETSKIEAKQEIETTNKTKTETKPLPKKTITEKEVDPFVNVSIPVTYTPKKPGEKVTVTDLDNHTCRWPIGDPKDENFHFCGATIKVGQTYCEEHAAIAYVKNIKK